MPLVSRTNQIYDLGQLRWEMSHLKISWKSDADGSQQTALQHRGDGSYEDACGSLKDRPDVSERDFSHMLPLYEGTTFSQIIEDFGAVRSRLMRKNMHTTYSVHKDKAKRYHLALDTHEHAYFIFPKKGLIQDRKEIFHIPADGYVYEVNTTVAHTVANCGPDRTHLVMVKK
jgi:hypothetical protein